MIINYYRYYEEIKNRLLLILIAWSFCLSICYSYKEAILFTLVTLNLSPTHAISQPYFIFTDVAEIFNVYLELILFISNQIGILFLIYQIFMFFSLGMYQVELVNLKFAMKVFGLLCIISILLLSKIILPFSWKFFLSFQKDSTTIQPISFFFEAKLIEYFHFFVSLYYVSFVSCQFLGVLTIILTNINTNLDRSKKFRKLFYLMFVLFSTVITPPDIVSQICISIILISVYEMLLFTWLIRTNAVTN